MHLIRVCNNLLSMSNVSVVFNSFGWLWSVSFSINHQLRFEVIHENVPHTFIASSGYIDQRLCYDVRVWNIIFLQVAAIRRELKIQATDFSIIQCNHFQQNWRSRLYFQVWLLILYTQFNSCSCRKMQHNEIFASCFDLGLL